VLFSAIYTGVIQKGSALNNYHIKVFVNHLELLSKFLTKIEVHVNSDPSILKARLIDGMLPLFAQVEIAASFSLRTSCPIASVGVVSFSQENKSFLGLQAQLRETVDYLVKLDDVPSDLSGCDITDMAGPVEVKLPAFDFINNFAFPNFFFHLSMVYAIARASGMPATKGDFDGIHKYPTGFSFEE